ncbi:TPA: serum opacification factor [Streptococcus pyogenes]|uniref:serum opacification factor n=1 Tax=Streptococcus pyogenes TaxID=1314 RepID=UPI0010D02578|nr:serum opacification factor [Streptococcus pyogenes]VHJ18763.1 Serum opacity factor [Streptococcus pyogenes]VHJ94730.1 Serum opacity factor [Streptococcus pyogenes]HEP1636093.1 fibronectin binding protein [Streptococcus pyogenes]HEP1640934.1 fibronectin binding protein [Streptococcus pyogenes]HEP2113730.1 fibronectin binding protein [Streptococcus pyogenes]
MTNCKYKLRKLSVGLVSVGTMLIAPTVLGQEVSTGASSTETSASTNTNTSTASAGTSTSETAASGTGSEAAVVSSEGSQSSESGQASTQPQAQTLEQSAATSPSSNSSTSSSEDKAPKAASTKSSSATVASSSNGSNQGAGAEDAPQMMDVERYTVDREKTELNIKDGKTPKTRNSVDKDTKLIRNRDGKQRDIVDIKREVKDNGDGTLDVTLKVTPKEIDKGADVMALLDVSKKMTDADFKNAKDKIKKLVTTLTSKSASNSDNDEHKHNSRNSVRLMTFYREISNPIDISGKTDAELDKLLDDLRVKAKANYDWGVDLQGAIHKAREIFNKEKESKKRQHIVLFSQGESTFSYDIQKSEKEKSSNLSRINEKITSSNPLLPWPPIFDHTHQNGDMINDVRALIAFASKLGIKNLSWIETSLSALSVGSNLLGSVFGGGGLGEYLTLKEYDSQKLNEDQFDYTKRVGEGYHYHSFSNRESEDKMPLETEIKKALEAASPKFEENNWFTKVLKYFGLKDKAEQAKLDVIMKVIKSVFYKRQYHYYNHNLSAIAEAKMAQKEGITFYSVDVTALNTARRVKRQTAVLKNTKEEERNKKFDEYLKKMSEGGNAFFNDVDKADKFKDTLTKLTIKDDFDGKVSVDKTSYQSSSAINYSEASNSFWRTTKESLTWTISKEQLKKAFEDGKPLTFTYKLKVDNNKFKTALEENNKKKRTKRSTPTENENSVTEKIISNTTTYEINEQKVEGNKLGDVSLTYSKFKVPVPQIDGHVIEPQAPTLPKLPPVIEHGPNFEYEEETGYQLPLKHGSNAPDTQVTIEEDTVPQRPDILVGGQSGPVDITEDTQPGMSGSNDATVVEEDTAPKRPDILVGGQSDPIDITEDTQPSVSGSNDATVVEEDTVPQRPDILVGGQSDPIDITEDTQPGMSGSNDATVIEEDTKPKRFFHFDNEPQAPEKPKEQPSLSLPQAPVYKAAHHLPASGDKREASFTIVALTIIGAVGLLSKKRRDTEEN